MNLSNRDVDYMFKDILKLSIYPIIGHKHTTYLHEVDIGGKTLFGNKYMGTFTSDKFPKLTDDIPYCIINVDTTNEPGSHWMGVCKYSGADKYLVFDSFGRKSNVLISNVAKIKKIVDTNYDKDQLVKQTDCGQRCLSFLVLCDLFGVDVSKKL
tara:strand:+ start:45 stop:506 length:462 start_codon:yes stop_codon:yes gene_type:complete